MRSLFTSAIALLVLLHATSARAAEVRSDVRAWQGTLTIPTYSWQDDVNPKFWALEGRKPFSTDAAPPIVYPYVMQDQISRTKVDHTYKALFLENEYLKVTCLPELDGRLHSVLDKTTGKEMFHPSSVIKPGMIAMRGAWISGGVEWNSGPHGHTVTAVSPVDALVGRNRDGSAWLEISNQEQIFRTRWTVRLTLHPGRAYLDQRIRLENPTDGMHPYYFWNCTAFPNGPGTRLIYPMTLGTDHAGREFFRWPVHEGRDMTWLKNYPRYASIFAVRCTYDFFGAYDADADRGIVQAADHRQLGGKKAWTWGEWEFGKVAERNLADGPSHYIEVQSGPLPTQSDYGMLGPHERVSWQEWWYPVHGLGDGFEYATRDVAVRTARRDGRLELRLLSTGRFPQASCVLARDGHALVRAAVDLSPSAPAVVTLAGEALKPVDVTITSQEGRKLAAFTTPLPIAKIEPPKLAAEEPDDRLTVEELYLKGRKSDRATERAKAREYYEKALARDSGHVASLRSLAVMDFESGLYPQAIDRLQRATRRDGDDGLSWFCLGASRLRLRQADEAASCGYRAARCSGTAPIGYDLAGRAAMQKGDVQGAIAAFEKAVAANGVDPQAADHLMLALHAAGRKDAAREMARRRVDSNPAALVPRALLGLQDAASLAQFADEARAFLGEADFELLEASLVFAELGLIDEAGRIVQSACVDVVRPSERSFLPLYYLAWFASQRQDAAAAGRWLAQAAATTRPGQFASRPEEVEILQYAVKASTSDAQASLQLGCLLANLGRVQEAIAAWQRAAAIDPKLSIAWRNLGLAAVAASGDVAKGEEFYRKAILARPNDQTLYRDLAQILLAADRRADAIRLLESMPQEGSRRGEITVLLARSYVAERRYDECVQLLESTPYFVNWEGKDLTWRLFNRAHLERGRQRLDGGDAKAALADFEAALTYPTNLNVGRPDQPEEAPAQYWRGKALAALGRLDEARAAWQAGASGGARKAAPAESGDESLPSQENEYRQKCRETLCGASK